MPYYDNVSGDLYEASFKGAVYIKGDYLDIFKRGTNGKILSRMLEKTIGVELSGMVFPRNHKLFEVLDDKLQQLFEGGVTEFIRSIEKTGKQQNDYAYFRSPGPQILTMKHLEAGFAVWLVSISFAMFAFICEWLVRLRDLLIFKYIFAAYRGC